MGKRERKFAKSLRKLEYYCLKKFRCDIFDKEVQRVALTKRQPSDDLRALAVAQKLAFLTNDVRLAKLVGKAMMHIG